MNFIGKYLLLIFLYLTLVGQKGNEIANTENTYKIVYLERFCRYIEWPKNANHIVNNKFKIGIIGKNPFGTQITKFFNKRKIKNRSVEVEEIKDIVDINNFDLVFVSNTVNNDIPNIVKIANGNPVLLIGDGLGFAKKGIHINYVLKDESLKFAINLSQIKKTKLLVDSNLLKIAVNIY